MAEKKAQSPSYGGSIRKLDCRKAYIALHMDQNSLHCVLGEKPEENAPLQNSSRELWFLCSGCSRSVMRIWESIASMSGTAPWKTYRTMSQPT